MNTTTPQTSAARDEGQIEEVEMAGRCAAEIIAEELAKDSARPTEAGQVVEFTKSQNRWYRITQGMIDRRTHGFASKLEVKAWAYDRKELCGENITLKFI